VAAKPTIAIVGPGRLGSALAVELKRAGYKISEIVEGNSVQSRRKAGRLARKVGAHASIGSASSLDSDVVWFCVPDREIVTAAHQLASVTDWKGRIAFHASGALASSKLSALRKRGASVASVHPLMTFVDKSAPSLKGVPFAIEGDAAAVQTARRIVRKLGGSAFLIGREHKAAYHAWGAFTSPLLIALLVTAERVARSAGLTDDRARKNMLPIVRQTIANYEALGAAGAFSGPLVRGDVETVRQHLRVLKDVPGARAVYLALARTTLLYLPTKNRKELQKLLPDGT